MGWVAELNDETKVKMVDEAGASGDAPPLMESVKTSADAHAARGEASSPGAGGEVPGEADRATSVKFTTEPSAEFSRAASSAPSD